MNMWADDHLLLAAGQNGKFPQRDDTDTILMMSAVAYIWIRPGNYYPVCDIYDEL
jgi:hypothetical protein